MGYVLLIIALSLLYVLISSKNKDREEGKAKEKHVNESLDPSDKDWEYQCELLDIIDPEEDDLI